MMRYLTVVLMWVFMLFAEVGFYCHTDAKRVIAQEDGYGVATYNIGKWCMYEIHYSSYKYYKDVSIDIPIADILNISVMIYSDVGFVTDFSIGGKWMIDNKIILELDDNGYYNKFSYSGQCNRGVVNIFYKK